jgi:hypothetical protein
MLLTRRSFASRHYSLASEFAGLCRRRDRRATMVFRCKQLFIGARRSLLLNLSWNRRDVLLARRFFFHGCRSRRDAACATVALSRDPRRSGVAQTALTPSVIPP